MRHLSEEEAAAIKAYRDRAEELLKNSDCFESNYGAVIFKDGKVLGEGYNYVPEIKGYTCDKCPRRKQDLHNGIGLELCYSVHAEESAINNMLFDKKLSVEDSEGASMVVVRSKDGKVFKFEELKPYCTRCAEKIYTQSKIKEIIYEDKKGFIAFGNEELFDISVKNLHSSWKEKFGIR
ncbi:deoxycytidylate deaminase [Candidatus Mancarchaeum acidiphilum]|uniref:Deoxycytidylate deaminase n=1 Tax=Candidatus Mancarchaeum acidiphilum TaxID=1920749 RepID=A0A218NMG7_9ARCH|nr:hypothetical protein [Candidatus Mancarchaeum acidiphilum]ASI13669.1 deoxycytidylate deaminase [Candidatus Mancarchaeum acidiphilum]